MAELFSKDGFLFHRTRHNEYSLRFTMENPRILLSEVLDMNLVKLIYELNHDVYEHIDMTTAPESNDEAVLVLVLKNLFEDIGLPQRYSHIHIQRKVYPQHVSFVSRSIRTHRPECVPAEATQMPIDTLVCDCVLTTPHCVSFVCTIVFDDGVSIPPFAEKMVGLILHKMFKRVKLFIESVGIQCI